MLWLAIASLTPLINIVMLSITNSLALIFPVRKEPGVAQQFESIGSLLIFMFVATTVLTVVFSTIAIAGILVYFATGTPAAAVISSWFVLLVFPAVAIKLRQQQRSSEKWLKERDV